MPRNASGTYTLPSGNPVVSGTVIESTWANSTLADLAAAITDSLSRSGEGGMTAPLRVLDGTVSIPGLGFVNETGSGLYRAAAGDVGLAVLGSRILRLQAAGASITGTLGVTGNVGIGAAAGGDLLYAYQASGMSYLHVQTGTSQNSGVRMQNATRDWLVINNGAGNFQLYDNTSSASRLLVDGSGNVGIGTDSPAQKLAIAGASGTLGAVVTSGSVSNYLQSSDTAGIVGTGGAHPLTFITSASERMRIDSSGNVGIGTSSPTEKLDVQGTIKLTNTINSANFSSLVDGGGLIITSGNSNPMYFYTGGTERARIDSSGNLLVGTTSNGGVGLSLTKPDVTGCQSYFSGTTTGFHWRFGSGAYGIVGSISSSSTATTYSTSSDYRLKENVAPMTGALAKVAALKPCTYTWKADGSAGQGFIAHELQAVVPDCVTGEKDAVQIVDVLDDEGRVIGSKEEPQYQGVDTSFLVATLVAAIQEQQTLITDLQADVAALKAVPSA